MLCTVAVKNIGCYYIRMTKMKFVIGRNKTSQSVTVGDTELNVKFKTKWTHFSGLKFESVVCRIVVKTTKSKEKYSTLFENPQNLKDLYVCNTKH